MTNQESLRQQYLENYPSCEDEINLLDMFIVLLKHKWMIFFLVFIAGVVAVIYSLMLPEIYRSESTIVPIGQEKASLSSRLSALGGFGAMVASQVGIGGAGSLEKFEIVLKSRELTNDLVEKHKLMPVIFEDSWDEKAKTWKTEEPPTIQDAYKAVQGMLEIKPDKKNGVLKLGFLFPNPALAQKLLNYYVAGMSEFLRQQSLENVAIQSKALQEQLVTTADPLLRTKLAEIIAQYVEKETLAKVQKYYGFNVIDSPFIPEKKFKPKRAQICILSVIVAFFMAVFLAFIMEYVGNLKKNEDPERLENLKKYIKPWNKK
ncbi:MAG: Wzz/FepE/Etk N-terminal domain-containing protein [Thermodesulfobacteriota bacterium]|nr:Wzz/FepE/Etk N-terminal domain-containing protein [Thermodesulfobacteriota bacterium]